VANEFQRPLKDHDADMRLYCTLYSFMLCICLHSMEFCIFDLP